MFRRIAEYVGVVGYCPVSSVVFTHFFQEFAEDVHGSVVAETGRIVLKGNGLMENAQYFTENSRKKVLFGFLAVSMFPFIGACQSYFLIQIQFVGTLPIDGEDRIVI